MYITINDIKGDKRIDLFYSIDSDKEVAVFIMLSDNIQYNILKLHSVMDPISDRKKDDFKWNLCKQRVALNARRDH